MSSSDFEDAQSVISNAAPPRMLLYDIMEHVTKKRYFAKVDCTMKRYRALSGLKIIVEGNLGISKTSFCRAATEQCIAIGIPTDKHKESAPEAAMTLFSSNVKKYAYSVQTRMAEACCMRDTIASIHAASSRLQVLDRSFGRNVVFEATHMEDGNINAPEHNAYI